MCFILRLCAATVVASKLSQLGSRAARSSFFFFSKASAPVGQSVFLLGHDRGALFLMQSYR